MKSRTLLKRTLLSWAAALFALWMLWTNLIVGFTKLTVKYTNLPEELDGLRIVHISDLHNWSFSGTDGLVIECLKRWQPDLIAITGDIVDAHHTNIPLALDFVEQLVTVAPCYYSTGNHESSLSEEERSWLMEGLEQLGVNILRDKAVETEKNGGAFMLVGLEDVRFEGVSDKRNKTIDSLSKAEDFTVVLSHQPQYYDSYRESSAELILSGHAHGGQARLPFLGGLYSPNQGILPYYDSGIYQDGDFAMVVSRGIGNSSFPVRFNNQPEIILLQLKQQ